MVTIRKINPEGYVTDLAVSPEQKRFVHTGAGFEGDKDMERDL